MTEIACRVTENLMSDAGDRTIDLIVTAYEQMRLRACANHSARSSAGGTAAAGTSCPSPGAAASSGHRGSTSRIGPLPSGEPFAADHIPE
jgi:hypothetical protein